MTRIGLGLFFVAMTTLMLELNLIRVFDVIWYSNMAYMVITLAMFCFGLSGVYSVLWPDSKERDPKPVVLRLCILFSVFSLAILPALNLLPINFNDLYKTPWQTGWLFLVMFLFLIVPFFLAGLIFAKVFSHYSSRIQTLYFWDLSGAGLGCIILIPFLPMVGPGGVMFFSSAFGLIAGSFFAEQRVARIVLVSLGVLIAAAPLTRQDYFEFKDHINKRNVNVAKQKNAVEDVHWDPISKIEVINEGNKKHVAYDGGSQSTYIFPFDGDYDQLREDIRQGVGGHFYWNGVFVSHALKEDSGHDALIIGAAGGAEIKAALMFGASRVDAVDLVGYVIEIGKTRYADYNGGIFNHPNVNALKGEGRSFIRSSDHQYDVIQMFSNHTSSSIAAGSGAMATNYLQTVEAYIEYFTHLKEDGILHINHHVYPRMVATAARAWRAMGREDFRSHILVLEISAEGFQDNLPTMLIKMEPWTEEEVNEVLSWFPDQFKPVVNPIDPENNMLSEEFFSGDLSASTLASMDYLARPPTDNQPYFNFLRKRLSEIEADPGNYLNFSTASLLNSQLKNGWIPTDIVHLIVTGIASLFFMLVFLLVPMALSKAGKAKWPGKISSLVYFSCLGAGFIIFELVFIQILMRLIGFPLYTYSAIVFGMLLAAGLGSSASGKFGLSPTRRWFVPFLGVLVCSFVVLFSYKGYSELFMQTPILVRIIAAVAFITPIGFFLGMFFPMGILTISNRPEGSIAWAWAMNGLFTVVGGFSCVLISLFFGFQTTLMVAMGFYLLAFFAFRGMRSAEVGSPSVAES